MWCFWWLLLHCGVTDTAGSCSCQWSELLCAARAHRHLHLQYLHRRHIKLLSGTSVQAQLGQLVLNARKRHGVTSVRQHQWRHMHLDRTNHGEALLVLLCNLQD